MTDQAIDYALRPTAILDHEDIEQPIRNALAEDRMHATADLPGLTLRLDYCTYADGTPLWDAPLNGASGMVIARRADGHTIEISADGQDWDGLTAALLDLMGDWDEQVALALTEARAAARKVNRLKEELRAAQATERAASVRAVRLGETAYRVAKTTGRSQVAIGTWVKK